LKLEGGVHLRPALGWHVMLSLQKQTLESMDADLQICPRMHYAGAGGSIAKNEFKNLLLLPDNGCHQLYSISGHADRVEEHMIVMVHQRGH
jgi:hypothetical protein